MKIYAIYLVMIFLAYSCAHKSARDNSIILDFSKINSEADTTLMNQQALRYFIEGTKLYNQKKYYAAIIEFLDAQRFDSSFAVDYGLAKSFRELKKYSLAEKHLLIALEKNPNFIDGLELLAEIQFLQGFLNNNNNLQKAVLTMEKVVELKPTEKNRFMLGRIYEYSDFNKSLEIYNELLQENPTIMVLNRMLEIYTKNDSREKYYGLYSDYKEILLKSPEEFYDIFAFYYSNVDYENILELLDYSYKALNHNQIAEFFAYAITTIIENQNEIYKKSAELFINATDSEFDSFSSLQFTLGILNYNIENYSKSEQSFARALRFTDSYEYLTGQIAYFYYSKSEYIKSIEFLKTLLTESSDPQTYLFISQIYSSGLGDNENALKYGKKAYESDSTDINIIGNLANIFNTLKEYEDSDYYYEAALKLSSKDPYINNNYAYSLAVRKKDLEKAKKMSKIAIEKEPLSSAFLDTYGWILFQMGETKNAMLYIEEATKKNNVGAEVFEHLGDIYTELGYTNKAIEAYSEGLEMAGDNLEIQIKIDNLKDANKLKD